jgi:HTH-type transcriptional regulator/antitoxin HigA
MKRILAKSTLCEFWKKYPDSEQYLKTWYDTALHAEWESPNDAKETYANASILKKGRIVFNIKGNSYRLVVRFNFEKKWAFIRFIGTHAEIEMTLKLIRTEKYYREALARMDEIFDAAEGTLESDEADILALLIDDYENQNYPIEAPDPIEAIKIRMEEMDLKQKDMAPAFGGKNRASEILNRKRKLTVEMIRNLAEKLNISASILIQDYELTR